MGWQDRDYSHPWEQWEAQRAGERDPKIPRPAAVCVVLIVIHSAAWLLVTMLRSDPGAADVARRMALSKDSLYAPAIALHPYAGASFLSLMIDIILLWTLGSNVARRSGTARTVCWYIAGNVSAGAAYWGVAAAMPAFADVPLESPLGAFAAWILVLWVQLRHEMVLLFGQLRRASHVIAVTFAVAWGIALLVYQVGGLAFLVAGTAGMIGMPLGSLLFDALRAAQPAIPRERTLLSMRPTPKRRMAHEKVELHRTEPRAAATATPTLPNIDDVLAKISRAGLASLTDDERARLEAARQARLRIDKRSHDTE